MCNASGEFDLKGGRLIAAPGMRADMRERRVVSFDSSVISLLAGVGERQVPGRHEASSVNILVLRHILQQFLPMNNDPTGVP